MKFLKFFLTMILVLFHYSDGMSQECKDFHKSNDCYVYVPLDRNFQIYNQAKSMQIEVGKPVIYKVVLYGKKDFIVGACAEALYYRKIHLRIIDDITGKVIFDNKELDYIESFGFSIDKTQPLSMEVTVLGGEKTRAKAKVCVGFQILWSDPVETTKK